MLTGVITLKWCKAPTYSSNVRLNISPIMKKTIDRLAQARFIKTDEETSKSETIFSFRLLTYYSIMQSLMKRLQLNLDGTTLQSAFQNISLEDVPASLHLAWRTEQAWLSGKPVFAYSMVTSYRDRLRKELEGNCTLRSNYCFS